jgi:hypothetical protein
MLKGHIACERGSQTTRPFHNKCRVNMAQRLYIRPIPHAYIMHSRPLDCTRSPLDQGIGQRNRDVAWTGSHQAGSGHTSSPDPL